MKRRISIFLLILTLIASALGTPALAEATRYTASTPLAEASRNNIKNIQRAAEAINGTKVLSGERFSFNELVGPRTKSKGYVSAENARGVSVTGGGVSQVATTLYLALLRLGEQVEFTKLSTYGSRFKGSYVSDGNKAVLTDYSGGTDFEFVNHAGDMTLELWTSETALNCVVTIADDDDWFGTWTTAPMSTKTISVTLPMSGDKGTLENVALAAKAVNGTRLATDDVFSFNKVVGPRTKKRGYTGGTNGRGVKVTGGGVAQVASAVWLAVKQMSDVSVIEKSTYGKRYNQRYVESAADAIVTDYNANKDFSFRYKGAGAITIYTTVENNTLKCDIAYE